MSAAMPVRRNGIYGVICRTARARDSQTRCARETPPSRPQGGTMRTREVFRMPAGRGRRRNRASMTHHPWRGRRCGRGAEPPPVRGISLQPDIQSQQGCTEPSAARAATSLHRGTHTPRPPAVLRTSLTRTSLDAGSPGLGHKGSASRAHGRVPRMENTAPATARLRRVKEKPMMRSIRPPRPGRSMHV